MTSYVKGLITCSELITEKKENKSYVKGFSYMLRIDNYKKENKLRNMFRKILRLILHSIEYFIWIKLGML